MITITKHLEFDAGHRVPSHDSRCKNAHGHRYKVDVEIAGDVLGIRGKPDDGMILDFGKVKELITSVIDPWDHAFLVYEHDFPMRKALGCLGLDHKTVALPVIPTAENLVWCLGEALQGILSSYATIRPEPFSLIVSHVRLFETPNSWADWYSTVTRIE